MKIINTIAFILVIVGALNWGLVGFFGFDLVAFLIGEMSLLARIVYGLVGISAILIAFNFCPCKCKDIK